MLIIGAVVGGALYLLFRATGRRRKDDPNATLWGTPMWLLGGLFYMNHTPDGQHQPVGLDGDLGAGVDPGYHHPGDFGGHGGGSDFGGGFGGGGDIGGGP